MKEVKVKSGVDFKQLKKFLLKYYGKKCKEYAVGCIVCSVWRVYEDLEKIIKDDD